MLEPGLELFLTVGEGGHGPLIPSTAAESQRAPIFRAMER